MAVTLAEFLLTPDTKPKVVADCCQLIDHQVAEASGLGGTALKLAYKSVNAFMPGHVRKMVASLLPPMVSRLEPYWADFSQSGGTFGDYLAKHGDEVGAALLTVTDQRAADSGRPVVIKAYNSVRGGASRHIQAALPQVGDMVVKYAPQQP